ncbi:MAG: gas vesicle protein GvpO [Rhodococcus sp. (in: high G+C Gram-positive bacteria)]
MTERAPRGRPTQLDRPLSVTLREAAEIAVQCIEELIDKPCEGATAVVPSDDGWIVEVEVIEDRRIPPAADVLALYEIEIGRDGTVGAYRRLRRYGRGRRDPVSGELEAEEMDEPGGGLTP